MQQIRRRPSAFLTQHRLFVGKVEICVIAMGFADAALVHSAKREVWMRELQYTFIDTNAARRCVGDHVLPERRSIAEHIQCQRLWAPVDPVNNFFFAFEREDWKDGSEDLFLQDERIRRHVGEYDRWDEVLLLV